VWDSAGAPAWRREWREDGGHLWHADNFSSVADTRLTSPVLTVSGDVPLIVAFDHAYSFEASEGSFWDGGVVEVKRVEDAEWTDLALFAPDIAYGGVIANAADNPLADRAAYVGESAGYPARTVESLDLGTAFAGADIQMRFRLGADQAAGAPGWDVDNVRVEGIVNQPFRAYVDEADICGMAGTTGTSTGDTETTTATTQPGDTDGDTGTDGPMTTGEPGDTGTPTTGASTFVPTDGGAEDATSAGASGTDTDPGETGEDGCGCRETRGGAGWLAWLLLAPRRRRR
jgi:hypothetical protein